MRSLQNISADARLDPLSDRKAQGYTDGRVKCRKPVEEPGTVPRVRIGNVVALLIEQKGSGFMSWLLVTMRFMRTSTCERINKSDEQAAARCLAERISFVFKVWCADHAFLFGRKGKRDEEQDVEAAGGSTAAHAAGGM
ncbi:MAG TPA: hypothetical protein H9970_04550 [Candidatus Merdibacter merdipullorum]|nr:hypothetical protein [Candidatus Merdibacter merdipullorum]